MEQTIFSQLDRIIRLNWINSLPHSHPHPFHPHTLSVISSKERPNSECHLHLAEVDCCRRVNELRFRFKFRKVGLAERRYRRTDYTALSLDSRRFTKNKHYAFSLSLSLSSPLNGEPLLSRLTLSLSLSLSLSLFSFRNRLLTQSSKSCLKTPGQWEKHQWTRECNKIARSWARVVETQLIIHKIH